MRNRTIIAVVILVVSVSSLIALAARSGGNKAPARAARQQQAGWLPSDIKALTLVSSEAQPGGKTVLYRLRNDSGRAIAGYAVSLDEGSTPAGRRRIETRVFVTRLDAETLQPGAGDELTLPASRAARLSGVLYDDASAEGDADSVASLRDDVINFEDGLRAELDDLEKISATKGPARAAMEVAARADAGAAQNGVVAENKTTGAVALQSELRRMTALEPAERAKNEVGALARARLARSWKGGAK